MGSWGATSQGTKRVGAGEQPGLSWFGVGVHLESARLESGKRTLLVSRCTAELESLTAGCCRSSGSLLVCFEPRDALSLSHKVFILRQSH